eukprot:GHVL01005287.1.p1 GENE.GHVL01005287.1~~GHVL01005287.1.p1  ORF type:complete len:339 (-),score=70.87 GHVL01005287.1:1472-2488(-)
MCLLSLIQSDHFSYKLTNKLKDIIQNNMNDISVNLFCSVLKYLCHFDIYDENLNIEIAKRARNIVEAQKVCDEYPTYLILDILQSFSKLNIYAPLVFDRITAQLTSGSLVYSMSIDQIATILYSYSLMDLHSANLFSKIISILKHHLKPSNTKFSECIENPEIWSVTAIRNRAEPVNQNQVYELTNEQMEDLINNINFVKKNDFLSAPINSMSIPCVVKIIKSFIRHQFYDLLLWNLIAPHLCGRMNALNGDDLILIIGFTTRCRAHAQPAFWHEICKILSQKSSSIEANLILLQTVLSRIVTIENAFLRLPSVRSYNKRLNDFYSTNNTLDNRKYLF